MATVLSFLQVWPFSNLLKKLSKNFIWIDDIIEDKVSLLLILERFVIKFELLFTDVNPKIFWKIKYYLKLVLWKILDVQFGSIELNRQLNADMSDTRFLQQPKRELKIMAKVKTNDQNHDRVWNQIRHTSKFTEDLEEGIMNFPELVEIHNAKLAVSEPNVDIIGNT